MSLLTKRLIAISIGAILGYVYWYYWGCQAGCSITAVWWRTSIWVAVMAYLLNDILQEYLSTRVIDK